ncbi:MAG: NYN domain-containing protein [Bacteroidetes bacterium]|nr:NYN domain-containing protein [Bacteroidota bacterium]
MAKQKKEPSAPQTSKQKKASSSQSVTKPKRQPSTQPAVSQKASPNSSSVARQKQEPAPQPVSEEKINIVLDQSVAILVDGNNIEMSLHKAAGKKSMINFDKLVPALLQNRALSRLIYFREGVSISQKLAERLQKNFHGSVVPCYKSADIPLTIKAVQVASKVDTIIILSGDADYVELVRHLKSDGIRVEVAAFPETTAAVLRSECDYFFPITVDYSFSFK